MMTDFNLSHILNYPLWTALVTPFCSQGLRVDLDSLKVLLEHQQQARHGVVLFGSTGEGLLLSTAEKKQILETVSSWGLNIPIMVGVPNHYLDEALSWLDFCQSLPLAGYLIATPVYTKPGIIGQTAWFEALLNRAHHPVMLYHIPGRSGVPLYPAVLKNLSQHPRWVALKDSGGTLSYMMECQQVAPHIHIYCGDDDLLAGMVNQGAKGLVSVASNVWPIYAGNILDALLNKKLIDPSVWLLWWQACKALFTASNPIPVKALMHQIGLLAHPTVRLPLHADDFQDHDQLLLKHRQLEAIFQS